MKATNQFLRLSIGKSFFWGILVCLMQFYVLLPGQLADFQVNEDNGSVKEPWWIELGASLAVNDNGSFVVTWLDMKNEEYIIYAQRYSSDGTALGNNFRVNDLPANEGNVPSISMSAAGSFVISWLSYDGNVYAQLFSEDARALGENILVNNPYDNNNCQYPTVGMDQAGSFIVAWDSWECGEDVYAQRFTTEGAKIGETFVVSEGIGTCPNRPVVNVDRNGNITLAWYEHCYNSEDDMIGPCLVAQRYSVDGTRLGGNFIVNEVIGYMWWSWGGPCSPSVISDSSGNVLFAWNENRSFESFAITDIYIQRYSKEGTALGSNVKVSTNLDSLDQYSSSLAVDEAGNFVVAWNRSGTSGTDIIAQFYTKDGSKQGTHFTISNTSDSIQHGPFVQLKNGKMYAVWKDNRAPSAGYDIWANVREVRFPLQLTSQKKMKVPELGIVQSSPNPFTLKTSINYRLNESGRVDLLIFNLLGQQVAKLVSEKQLAGNYKVEWIATNMPSGIYICQFYYNSRYVNCEKLNLCE